MSETNPSLSLFGDSAQPVEQVPVDGRSSAPALPAPAEPAAVVVAKRGSLLAEMINAARFVQKYDLLNEETWE